MGACYSSVRLGARKQDACESDAGRDRLLGCAATVTTTSATSSSSRFDTPALPVDRDHYRVESEHARGGLGRVLRARDLRLDRTVAIKELLVSSDDAERRFIREAHLTARLQHPSIVPVYELSTRDGRPFYAMKLITGCTLKELLDGARDFDERLALLPHAIAVADAIAYAHSNRVVHRDIKPSNVVVGAFGETVVIDWGLAKDLSQPHEAAAPAGPYRDQSSQLTAQGSVVGTPAYMPPEQAAGAGVDERADVYALGALLYHLLAGEPPYRGATASEVLAQVLAAPPPPVARRQPSVPADLAAIVDKAMARAPEARYANGSQFADDLRRFQTGQLVLARSYSKPALLARWAWRHRLPLSFLVVLAAAGGLAVSRVVRERNRAEARGNELTLAQARAWLDRDPTTAAAWLKHYPADGSDWSGVRDVALDAEAAGVARHVFHRANSNSFSDFSPDGTRLVVAGEGDALEVRDVASGAIVRSLTHAGLVARVAFIDGERIVFFDTRRLGLHVWNLTTGREQVLGDGEGDVRGLAACRDGRTVATSDTNGTVRLFDIAAGTVRALGAHRAVASHVRFSPDGRRLASVADDHTLILWDLADGTHREIGDHGDLVRTDFSPDGKTLAASGVDGTVHVWSLDSGEHRVLRGHEGLVADVRFSHDGTLLASAGEDKTVRLWSWRQGSARVLRGHTDQIWLVTFSPDDRTLASAGRDETVRLWSTSAGAIRVLRGHTSSLFDVAFSSDGRWLYSNSLDHTVRVWRVAKGPVLAPTMSSRTVEDVAFVDDGELIGGGDDARGVVARVADGVTRAVTPAGGGSVRRVIVSSDRSRAAVLLYHGRVSVYERGSARTPEYDTAPAPAWAAAFAPDGKTLAIAAGDGSVRLWQPDGGGATVLSVHAGDVYSVAYSRDGRWLASAGADGAVHLWDLAHQLAHRQLLAAGGPRVALVAFADDRAMLAAVDWSGRARLWDLDRGQERVLDDGHRDRLITVAFQPHGDHLAVAGDDGAIRLWSRDGRIVRTLRGHHGVVQHVAFSPDGTILASASDDHTVRLWSATTGAELQVLPSRTQVRRVAFAPGGALVAAASREPDVQVWSLRNLAAADERPAAVRDWLFGLTTAETDTFAITSSR